MNKLFLAIPLSLIVIASVVGVIAYQRHHSHHDVTNHTTFYQLFQCANNLTHAQCDDLQNETEKILCNKASKLVSDLTFPDSPLALQACAKFNEYNRIAASTEEINANKYYENCYTNSEVIKGAATSKYYNEKIFTPFRVKCAGF